MFWLILILLVNLWTHIFADCEILKAEPELADLMSQIAGKIPAEWELFGAQLNIQQSEMDAIKINNLGNCDLCFQHLLSEWKRTKPTPVTWLTIIKALYSPSVRGYALAEKVYKHLTAIRQNI